MASLKASLCPVQAALLAVIASAVGLQWASLQLLACAGMTLTNFTIPSLFIAVIRKRRRGLLHEQQFKSLFGIPKNCR